MDHHIIPLFCRDLADTTSFRQLTSQLVVATNRCSCFASPRSTMAVLVLMRSRLSFPTWTKLLTSTVSEDYWWRRRSTYPLPLHRPFLIVSSLLLARGSVQLDARAECRIALLIRPFCRCTVLQLTCAASCNDVVGQIDWWKRLVMCSSTWCVCSDRCTGFTE